MKNSTTKAAPTFESVWALMQENASQIKENERIMEKSRADFDRRMEESRVDFDQRMKNLEKAMGSWANNHGSFAEEYFFNSFENGKQNFFDEKFDTIKKYLHQFFISKNICIIAKYHLYLPPKIEAYSSIG